MIPVLADSTIPPPPVSIRLPILLLVEGRDDQEFFEALLVNLGLSDQIEVRDYKGRNNLLAQLKVIAVTPGFTDVRSLAIVRDADENANGALDSIRYALRMCSMPSDIQHGVITPGEPSITAYILPDGIEQGCLETLCLRAIEEEPAIGCVIDYFECVTTAGIQIGDPLKARVRAYIAACPEPTVPLGIGARKGYFRLDHPTYDAVKGFLRSLA